MPNPIDNEMQPPWSQSPLGKGYDAFLQERLRRKAEEQSNLKDMIGLAVNLRKLKDTEFQLTNPRDIGGRLGMYETPQGTLAERPGMGQWKVREKEYAPYHGRPEWGPGSYGYDTYTESLSSQLNNLATQISGLEKQRDTPSLYGGERVNRPAIIKAIAFMKAKRADVEKEYGRHTGMVWRPAAGADITTGEDIYTRTEETIPPSWEETQKYWTDHGVKTESSLWPQLKAEWQQMWNEFYNVPSDTTEGEE